MHLSEVSSLQPDFHWWIVKRRGSIIPLFLESPAPPPNPSTPSRALATLSPSLGLTQQLKAPVTGSLSIAGSGSPNAHHLRYPSSLIQPPPYSVPQCSRVPVTQEKGDQGHSSSWFLGATAQSTPPGLTVDTNSSSSSPGLRCLTVLPLPPSPLPPSLMECKWLPQASRPGGGNPSFWG